MPFLLRVTETDALFTTGTGQQSNLARKALYLRGPCAPLMSLGNAYYVESEHWPLKLYGVRRRSPSTEVNE